MTLGCRGSCRPPAGPSGARLAGRLGGCLLLASPLGLGGLAGLLDGLALAAAPLAGDPADGGLLVGDDEGLARLQGLGEDDLLLAAGGDGPGETGRIDHHARAVAVELILHRPQQGGAGLDGRMHHRVAVVHVEQQLDRRAAKGGRPERAEVGILVGDHHHGVADRELGVADLPRRLDQPVALLGAERADIEGEGRGGVLRDEVRGDGGVSSGHGKLRE